MNRHIVRAALVALVVVIGLGVLHAASVSVAEGLKSARIGRDKDPSNPQSFKLKAGGQLDPAGPTISFAGQATHFGQFTAAGQYDPETLLMHGTLNTGQGDVVSFSSQFVRGADGELTASLLFGRGTGRFAAIWGSAAGPVALDSDSLFTIGLEGVVDFRTTSVHACMTGGVCSTTCEGSVYTIGYCVDNVTGAGSPISIECCCCTEGWENRSFHGE